MSRTDAAACEGMLRELCFGGGLTTVVGLLRDFECEVQCADGGEVYDGAMPQSFWYTPFLLSFLCMNGAMGIGLRGAELKCPDKDDDFF